MSCLKGDCPEKQGHSQTIDSYQAIFAAWITNIYCIDDGQKKTTYMYPLWIMSVAVGSSMHFERFIFKNSQWRKVKCATFKYRHFSSQSLQKLRLLATRIHFTDKTQN